MPGPLVSVIIPNYNHAPYLHERISSVLNQTYDNIEVFILDDNSSDNSVEVLNDYKGHPKVKQIIINDVNSGSTFKQWEKGFALAEGEYIWIAESDDVADPRFLREVIDGINKDTSVVLAFANSDLINAESQLLSFDPDEDDKCSEVYSLHDGRQFIFDRMLYRNRLYNASAIVFRRDALLKIGREFAEYKFCGDWAFWLDILKHGKILWLHRKYNKFRKHLIKVSPKADREGLDYLEKHRLIIYMKEQLFLSNYKIISIVGNIYLNLIRSKVISEEARKRELKSWIQEYPLIILYALLRLFQVLPRRLFALLGLTSKYPRPKAIKRFNYEDTIIC